LRHARLVWIPPNYPTILPEIVGDPVHSVHDEAHKLLIWQGSLRIFPKEDQKKKVVQLDVGLGGKAHLAETMRHRGWRQSTGFGGNEQTEDTDVYVLLLSSQNLHLVHTVNSFGNGPCDF
jgi:hypothetical protein